MALATAGPGAGGLFHHGPFVFVIGILLHRITHGAYHRGKVGQLIKSIGKAPPRDLYTRFLHLREPVRREGGLPHK